MFRIMDLVVAHQVTAAIYSKGQQLSVVNPCSGAKLNVDELPLNLIANISSKVPPIKNGCITSLCINCNSSDQISFDENKFSCQCCSGDLIFILSAHCEGSNFACLFADMNDALLFQREYLFQNKNQSEEFYNSDEASRLKSLGLISTGLIHEINNPIGYIQSNLEYLFSCSIEMFDKVRSCDVIDIVNYIEENVGIIKECIVGSTRIIEIVSDVREYARPDENTFEYNDISKSIEQAIKLTKGICTNKSKVELINEAKGVIVCHVPGKITQVFINLISNSIHAMQKYGSVTITTRVIGDEFIVEVADNGAGMNEEVKSNLFQKFKTTKKKGEGTGFGLSVCRDIVEEHGGVILFESELGIGTTFIIKLPITQNGAQ